MSQQENTTLLTNLYMKFCKLFGSCGVPEYACGAQACPDFLALMSQSGESAEGLFEYYTRSTSWK